MSSVSINISGITGTFIFQDFFTFATMFLRTCFFFFVCLAFFEHVEAGTCVCSSGVTWASCPNGGACHSFCSGHGGVRYWGGPGYKMTTIGMAIAIIIAMLGRLTQY